MQCAGVVFYSEQKRGLPHTRAIFLSVNSTLPCRGSHAKLLLRLGYILWRRLGAWDRYLLCIGLLYASAMLIWKTRAAQGWVTVYVVVSQPSKPTPNIPPAVLHCYMCPMLYIPYLPWTPRGCARCPKPVISAIHSACVGGGVDLVCATDIRLVSSDAWFSIKEARVALVFWVNRQCIRVALDYANIQQNRYDTLCDLDDIAFRYGQILE